MKYTYFRVQMYIAYNGINCPDGIHPSRWRAMLARIMKDE